MKESNAKKISSGFAGTLAAVLLFALLAVIGGVMLFVSSMKLEYFCYVAGGVFIAYGALLILKYFAKKGYHDVNNYDFSAGVLLIILGVVTIVRAMELTGAIAAYLGVMVLMAGVIVLQHTIEMKSTGTNDGIVVLNLLIAVLVIFFSVFVLLDLKQFFTEHEALLYALLLTVGFVGVISQIITAIQTKRFHTDEERSRVEVVTDYDVKEPAREEEPKKPFGLRQRVLEMIQTDRAEPEDPGPVTDASAATAMEEQSSGEPSDTE